MTKSAARSSPRSLTDLAASAAITAEHLQCLANKRRLVTLYHLAVNGEMDVTSLAEAVGLQQSPMSQHLAVLRKAKIIAPRRVAQTVFYRLSDIRAERLLWELWTIYIRAGREST